MRTLNLVIIFFVAFSLASLAGLTSKNVHLPTVSLVKGNPQPCDTHSASGACSEYWYPAGPEMNTELATVFTDQTSELSNIQAGNFASIDLTDSPLSAGLVQTFTSSPNFRISASTPGGFGEVEFNLANNFWGCPFGLGNQSCGVDIRDGIAHLIDKVIFVSSEGMLAGQASAIDDPEPTYNGGLPSANPCAWDSEALQSGSNCKVGAPGGTAYHFQTATGADGYQWLQANPSPDFCIAAYDIKTGINSYMPILPPPNLDNFLDLANAPGGGFPNTPVSSWTFDSSTNCLLKYNHTAAANWVASHPVNFYIRSDNLALKDLGTSLAAEICFLLTGNYSGSYSVPCAYPNSNPILTEVVGHIGGFAGFAPSCNGSSPNLCWWMYTSGMALHGPELLEPSEFSDKCCVVHDPFDTSLYFTFNSRFVSAVPSIQCSSGSGSSCSPGPCSAQSAPALGSSDYMYVCSPTYDVMSSAVENAPCITAQGDPAVGAASNLPSSPGNGLCPGTTQLSAISAGLQAEDLFGRGAFTIPIYNPSNQYGYLSNWSRVINNVGGGIPSYFTWLNAHSSNPAQPGTIRQGMSETSRSVNPYIAATFWDLMIMGNVYDTLFASNPLSDTQLFDWMTISAFQKSNASLGYTAPPHTVTSYRFTLRDDLYFQDGSPVTSYDVAFSYLSMDGTGAILGAGIAPMTGITILSPHQFDIGVNSLGVFVFLGLTGVPIVPGFYWTSANNWLPSVSQCSGSNQCPIDQYTLSGAQVNCSPNSPDAGCGSFLPGEMRIDPNKITATYDPIANHIFVGSGPFQCGTVTSSGSGLCSSTGGQNPPTGGSYTLTRFGKGLAPASSVSGMFFRSSGNLALWIWSQQNSANPSTVFGLVQYCYNKPVDLSGSCAHFQQGIGNPGPAPVGLAQVAIENRFYALDWTAPYNWDPSVLLGITPLAPILYEGSTTLNPARVATCTPDYPTGGYDC
jgi:hypothetical protein